MTAKYGKQGEDLIAISKPSNQLEEAATQAMYEVVWTIDESNINNIISMLIDCSTLDVADWRIQQIRDYYEITDKLLIKVASDQMKIRIYKDGDRYMLKGNHTKTGEPIEARCNDILIGIVQMFVLSGIDIRSSNNNPSV